MGGGLGVGDVSPYVSPSPPSMYPTNSLPPFTPKPAPPPFPPPSRPHIPPPPHPYPCNLPSLPPISGLAPRLGVPPPLSLPERPHRWVRGGCTPRALHGVGGGGAFCAGLLGWAALRGGSPPLSVVLPRTAPSRPQRAPLRCRGGGDAHCWGGGGDGLGSPRSQTPPGGSSQHPVSPRQRHDGPPRPPFGQLAASRRHHTPR